MADEFDIIYFSARKFGFARGGCIAIHERKHFEAMRELVPMYEGFLTYGGMSVREMEAITVGLDETMDEDVISQGPIFIDFMSKELMKRGVPVVTPAGGLGCHLNAREFLPHVDDHEYPAGALAAAVYLAGGMRGMERGTLSEQREPDGTEPIAEVELLRLAHAEARLHHEPGALRRGPHHVAASRTASSSAACAGWRSRAACASSSAASSPPATGRTSWSGSSARTLETAYEGWPKCLRAFRAKGGSPARPERPGDGDRRFAARTQAHQSADWWAFAHSAAREVFFPRRSPGKKSRIPANSAQLQYDAICFAPEGAKFCEAVLVARWATLDVGGGRTWVRASPPRSGGIGGRGGVWLAAGGGIAGG